jgi:hypothetical protein
MANWRAASASHQTAIFNDKECPAAINGGTAFAQAAFYQLTGFKDSCRRN